MLVKQIQNLVELLELFGRLRRPVASAEIVRATGWPRSSVFNILDTLMEHGLLYEPVPRGGYYLWCRLPDGVDSGKIDASFKNGVLTVTMPKTAEAQKPVKKVEIKAA